MPSDDPEVPQAAPPEAQPGQQTFDEALKDLVAALVEGGATPQQAMRTAEQAIAVPRPRYAHRAEVGAGGYGLPYLPPSGSLALIASAPFAVLHAARSALQGESPTDANRK
jgi:hypothetical protein